MSTERQARPDWFDAFSPLAVEESLETSAELSNSLAVLRVRLGCLVEKTASSVCFSGSTSVEPVRAVLASCGSMSCSHTRDYEERRCHYAIPNLQQRSFVGRVAPGGSVSVEQSMGAAVVCLHLGAAAARRSGS